MYVYNICYSYKRKIIMLVVDVVYAIHDMVYDVEYTPVIIMRDMLMISVGNYKDYYCIYMNE